MSTVIKPPNYRTGKICYIEIPATDVKRSAEFYGRAFGWQTRQRGDGSTAFDDTVNQVSGTWVLGRPVAAKPGLMVYVMVGNAADAVKAIVSAGGEIVDQVDANAREIVATFRDPAGNLIGIYQQPGLAEAEARESSAAVHQSSD
jgi:predicted enzyme related to lactoylglutathione lyase